MRDINVKLWRNHQNQDWSAEINGVRYDSVSIDVIEGLVQHALYFGEPSASQPAGPQRIH